MKETYVTQDYFHKTLEAALSKQTSFLTSVIEHAIGEATRQILEVVDARFQVVEADIQELKKDTALLKKDMSEVKKEIKNINHKLDVNIDNTKRHDAIIGYNIQINTLKQLPA